MYVSTWCHRRRRSLLASVILAMTAVSSLAAAPAGTVFTYQGNLELSGAPVNGTADFQMKLFDALTGGTQVGTMQSVNNVTVSEGGFTVQLDFGAGAFNGDKRFLEIAVRSPAGGGTFTTMTPRQELTAAPYALKVPGVDGHSLDAVDGAPTDALFVGPDGNVGVGTTSPVMPLHVRDDEPVMLLQDTSPSSQQSGYLGFWNDVSAETGWVGFGTPGSPHFTIFNGRSSGDLELRPGPSGRIRLLSQGNDRLTVASSGNIGIGTNTPSTPIHVNNEFPVLVLQDSGPASTQSGYVGFWNNSQVETAWAGYGTPGSPHFTVLNARAGGNIVLTPGSGGVVSVPVLEITGADLAERFPSSDATLEPGMVVAIDPREPGQVCLARGAYNARVAGVVSGANDFKVGAVLGNLPGHEDAPAIALSGRVYVWCDASNGPIEAGDLLTTSDTPGHAMKAADHERSHGACLGKAMTRLEEGRGLVLVLINLQ